MEDTAIQALLSSLSRQHPSGGKVVERSAVLAAGSDFPQVLAWISDHGGLAEMAAAPAAQGGLHGSQVRRGNTTSQRAPLRYVLGAGVLD